MASVSSSCYLEFVQVLQLANEIALQVQYFQVTAQLAKGLDALNVLLMQGHLLQSGQDALVMLSPLQALPVNLSKQIRQPLLSRSGVNLITKLHTFRSRSCVILVMLWSSC